MAELFLIVLSMTVGALWGALAVEDGRRYAPKGRHRK